MEFEYTVLARAADLSADGTISALGMGFDRIRTAAVPSAFPIVFIARLRDTQGAAKLLVELEVNGPNGSILDAPFVNELSLKKVDPAVALTPPNMASILIGMPGLMFPAFGKYDFKITVTGANAVTRTISLMVEQQGNA